jgi:hypothetical protein
LELLIRKLIVYSFIKAPSGGGSSCSKRGALLWYRALAARFIITLTSLAPRQHSPFFSGRLR